MVIMHLHSAKLSENFEFGVIFSITLLKMGEKRQFRGNEQTFF